MALGLNCCCGPPCEICDDDTPVDFLVALTGIADGTAVPDPPGLDACATCSALNTAYPMTYQGVASDIPVDCLTLSDPPDDPYDACKYTGGVGACEGTGGGATFTRTVSITLWIYLSGGGDIRGYLTVTIFSSYTDSLGATTSRTNTVACDFLIDTGVTTTSCAVIDVTDTFTQCGTFAAGYDCDPPTGFNFYAA